MAFRLFEGKVNSTPEGISKMKEIIQGMNSRRTEFT
jgi:hypothetical protein